MGAGVEVWATLNYYGYLDIWCFSTLFKEGWKDPDPSMLPPPCIWISCLFERLDWQSRRLRPSVSTWAGRAMAQVGGSECVPGDWAQDHLWGREKRLSEGPLRSSPSFAPLFPVWFRDLGGGRGGRLCLSTLSCYLFFHEEYIEGGRREWAWGHDRGPKLWICTVFFWSLFFIIFIEV